MKSGSGADGGLGFVPTALCCVLGCLCVLRQLQHEPVLRLLETRHRNLPGKACEAAAQVHLCVAVFFGFASRVLGIWLEVVLDRLRPDDSILSLVSVLGRFDK